MMGNLLAPLPALVIGVLVMQRSGVSSIIWGQHLAAGIALLILCGVISLGLRRNSHSGSRARAIVAGGTLLLLAATLAHPGVEGVRRWVFLGPLQVHAAFVALPALLIVLGAIARREGAGWLLAACVAAAAGVLALQPDVSQASAFAIAVIVILFLRERARTSDWTAGAIVMMATSVAWSRADALEEVPHVEGIVGLAANLGHGWLIAAVLALALLPLPFISAALRRRELRPVGASLAAYFGIACIAPFVGPFPIPLLGFGLSPIVGYVAALGWIIVRSESPER